MTDLENKLEELWAASAELGKKAWAILNEMQPTEEENEQVTSSLYDQAHDLGGEAMAEDPLLRIQELQSLREMAAEDEQATIDEFANESEP